MLLTKTSTPSCASFGRPAVPSQTKCSRSVLVTRAERKRLDFSTSKSGSTGYLKEDSAGQENIFAVESKAFVAGGSKDTGGNKAANAAYAGLAFAIGILAIGLGVLLTKDKGAVSPAKILEEVPKESLSSISKRLSPAIKRAVEEAPALSE